jgi:hypothetical protein
LAAIAAGGWGNIFNDSGLILDGEKAPHTPGGWGNILNDAGLITDGEKAFHTPGKCGTLLNDTGPVISCRGECYCENGLATVVGGQDERCYPSSSAGNVQEQQPEGEAG